jgi:hypothetical protein
MANVITIKLTKEEIDGVFNDRDPSWGLEISRVRFRYYPGFSLFKFGVLDTLGIGRRTFCIKKDSKNACLSVCPILKLDCPRTDTRTSFKKVLKNLTFCF